MNITWINNTIFLFSVPFLGRMAANNEQFLTKVLGIKDPKHRSKITIKAMDVVLFGPPKGQCGICMVILLLPFSICIQYCTVPQFVLRRLTYVPWLLCSSNFLKVTWLIILYAHCILCDWKRCLLKYGGKPWVVRWTKKKKVSSQHVRIIYR